MTRGSRLRPWRGTLSASPAGFVARVSAVPEIYIRGLALKPNGQIVTTYMTREVIRQMRERLHWVILLDPESERQADIQETYRADVERRRDAGGRP